MEARIANVFTEASRNAVHQPRCILKMKALYKKSNRDKFLQAFLRCLMKVTRYEKSNKQVDRCIKFAAAFCGTCIDQQKDQLDIDDAAAENVVMPDPFVEDLITSILKSHNAFEVNLRYYVCRILNQMLEQFTNVHLGGDICINIQNAMLKRLLDKNFSVREQSVLAVMRLQDISDEDCPVLNAFTERITTDPHPLVRKALVQKVAVTTRSLPVIFDSILSVDAMVRNAAYVRFAAFHPRILEISQRQLLVVQVSHDDHEPNRAVLERALWPQWLQMHRAAVVPNKFARARQSLNSSDSTHTLPEVPAVSIDPCLQLLNCLLLDEDDDKLDATYNAFRAVLKVHFKLSSMEDLIKVLRLDENKLVTLEDLTLETAFYWRFLLKHVKNTDGLGDHADEILPELTPFCTYIDRYINEKMVICAPEHYMFLPRQHILMQLLKMASLCDLSDEVGRSKLKDLVINILLNVKNLEGVNTDLILLIYSKIEKDYTIFAEKIYDVITDIMQPIKVIPLHADVIQNREFTLAKLRVALNIAQDSHDDALRSKDYLLAGKQHAEIVELRERIGAVPDDAMLQAQHERQQLELGVQRLAPSRDPAVQLHCCNILCALLKVRPPRVRALPPVLYAAKIDFLEQFLDSKSYTIFAKTLTILTYYSIIDKDIASKALEIMTSPIISYRLIAKVDTPSLIAALDGFTCILIRYGVDILHGAEPSDGPTPPEPPRLNHSLTKRLDRLEDLEDMNLSDIPIEQFQEIIMDMMSDEDPWMCIQATLSIISLLKHNIAVNSTVISKLLLKWFDPETSETNPRLLYIISSGISGIGKSRIQNIEEIMEESAMISLKAIYGAGKQSTLIKCDLPKCLQFLAAINSITEPNVIHKNLALKILIQTISNTDPRFREIYLKFLLYLDPPLYDNDAIKECEILVNKIDANGQKIILSNISKYQAKLRQRFNENGTESLGDSTQATLSSLTSTNILAVENEPIANTQESRLSDIRTAVPILNDVVNSTPIVDKVVPDLSIDETPINKLTEDYHISSDSSDTNGEIRGQILIANVQVHQPFESSASIGLGSSKNKRGNSTSGSSSSDIAVNSAKSIRITDVGLPQNKIGSLTSGNGASDIGVKPATSKRGRRLANKANHKSDSNSDSNDNIASNSNHKRAKLISASRVEFGLSDIAVNPAICKHTNAVASTSGSASLDIHPTTKRTIDLPHNKRGSRSLSSGSSSSDIIVMPATSKHTNGVDLPQNKRRSSTSGSRSSDNAAKRTHIDHLKENKPGFSTSRTVSSDVLGTTERTNDVDLPRSKLRSSTSGSGSSEIAVMPATSNLTNAVDVPQNNRRSESLTSGSGSSDIAVKPATTKHGRRRKNKANAKSDCNGDSSRSDNVINSSNSNHKRAKLLLASNSGSSTPDSVVGSSRSRRGRRRKRTIPGYPTSCSTSGSTSPDRSTVSSSTAENNSNSSNPANGSSPLSVVGNSRRSKRNRRKRAKIAVETCNGVVRCSSRVRQNVKAK